MSINKVKDKKKKEVRSEKEVGSNRVRLGLVRVLAWKRGKGQKELRKEKGLRRGNWPWEKCKKKVGKSRKFGDKKKWKEI